jgi:hypothetical protein
MHSKNEIIVQHRKNWSTRVPENDMSSKLRVTVKHTITSLE